MYGNAYVTETAIWGLLSYWCAVVPFKFWHSDKLFPLDLGQQGSLGCSSAAEYLSQLVLPKLSNSLAPGRCCCNRKLINFKVISSIDLEHILCNYLQVNATRPHLWLVKLGSDNGLVPSGNKPLPEPMLTQFFVAIWYHQTTMSWLFITRH